MHADYITGEQLANLPVKIVYWVDSMSSHGWSRTLPPDIGAAHCSIGKIIERENDVVLISSYSMLNESSEAIEWIQIPKCCVQSIQSVNSAK